MALSWVSKASVGTDAIHQSPGFTAPDGKIYVYNDNQFLIYNPTTDTWSTSATAPFGESYSSAGGFRSDGQIWLFTQNNAVYIYNPTTDTWSSRAITSPFGPMIYGDIGADGKIYAAAGGQRFAQFVVYDPATNAQTVKATAPITISFLGRGPAGLLYGFDEGTGSLAFYNPGTNTWTLKATRPAVATNMAACFGPDGKLYTFGGDAPSAASRAVYSYNPTANIWSAEANLPVGRDQLVAASSGGSVYVTGGSDGAGDWTQQTWAAVVNVAPNAPPLISPTDTATIDLTVDQRFRWTFSDPGDSQSKFDLRYSSNGGTTWTTITGVTPNNFVVIAAGTFTAGSYQWQVRTYDSQGWVGPWSASSHFTAAAPASGPTITYPASGGVVDAGDRVDWSFTGQQAYQVQRIADNAGVMADPSDPANTYFDSGPVVNASTRSIPLSFDTNDRYEWIRLTVESGGLWTAWTAERVHVSYDPPDVPTATITTDAGNARMWVDYDDTGGSSPGEYVNVYWSRDGGATVESSDLMLPPTGTSVFWTPASGVDYVVQVQAVAANGVTASTDWLGATTVVIDGGTGGPVDLVLDGGTP